MKNKDLELRKLYQRILEALLMEDFSIDYFSLNRNVRELVIEFLQNQEFKNTRNNKKELLAALKQINLKNYSDDEILLLTEYSNVEYCEYLLSDYYSLFSELSDKDKTILVFVDLCCNSKLKSIFQSKKIPFNFEDFYYLIESVTGITEEDFKETMSKAEKLNLAVFNESKKKIGTTNTFEHELVRLSTIPPLGNLDVTDFVVSGYDCTKPLSKIDCIAFAGDDVDTFVYSKLKEEKLRFWFCGNYVDGISIFRYFKEHNLYNSECVWLSYRKPGTIKEESLLVKIAEETKTKIIISGTKNDLFGRTYCNVVLKDSAIDKKVDLIFPPELAKPIHEYLEKILPAEKKRAFISELYKIASETDPFYVQMTLPEIFKVFKQKLGKDDVVTKPKFLCVIDQEDFEKRYGNGELFADNQISPRIREIHRQLSQPLKYLKANLEILTNLEAILDQHPNILNKDDLLLSLKTSVLFARENIIRLEPLLLIGSPGCGKSLLARQLREILGQENDVTINLGDGGGTNSLLGSSPEWKGASNGRVLSSIWEANRKGCLGNPIIVLEELDKANFNVSGSNNFQDILPAMLLLCGDENRKHYRDLYFEVPVRNFYPNIICTGNKLEPLLDPHVESLFNRLRVIKFRDYTPQELKEIVIPLRYEAFRKEHNNLVPEKLSTQEIDIIYEMCNGQTRQIVMSVKKYLGTLFDLNGKRRTLSPEEIDCLIKTSKMVYEEKRVGFCR